MRRGGHGAGGGLHSTASGGILSWAGTTSGRCASLAPGRLERPLRGFASRSPPPLGVGSVRFRPSWGVRLLALTIAGTSTFYFSQSAWLNGLGDEPCYSLDRVRNDKRPVVYSDDYDQNWWGLERLLPLPLTLQDRKYHGELAQGLVEKGVIKADQFIMPEVPTKEDLKEYNTPEYLTSLNQSRRLAEALGNPTLRYFPSLVIHTFVSGFMLEAVGGTVLASRVALERGWAINLGGGFHHASASSGSQGSLFNDVSLAIKHVRRNERGKVSKFLIVDLTATQGDGFVADFGLDENVYLVDSHTDQPDGGHKRSRARVGASLGVPRQGMPKEEYLRWVATEVEKAITTFRPHMVFYISGSSPTDPTQGEDWVVDRDALVFRLAVDTHSIPLVMVVSGGWTPGNDPGVMKTVVEPLLAQDAAWASVREGFAWLVLLAPDLWMDVAWTAAVCHDRRRTFVYRSFIYSLATCLLFSYAGGVTMHMAIGEAPPVLRSNVALLASAATWFVMFFTPLRHLYNFFPVKLVLVALQAICWQRCVCWGVDLGISRFPNSFVTPVLLAIFAGSAGGVLMNIEKRFFGMDGGTSTLGVKLSLLSGLAYYSQHPAALSHGILAPSLSLDDTKVLIGAVLVGWSIVAELWGPINPFAAVEAVFGFVFLAGTDEQATTWRSVAVKGRDASKQRAPAAGSGKPKSRNQEKQTHSTDDEAHDDYSGSPAAAAALRNRKKRK